MNQRSIMPWFWPVCRATGFGVVLLVLVLAIHCAEAEPVPQGTRAASSNAYDDTVSSTLESLLDFSSEQVSRGPVEPEETNVVKALYKKSLALRDPFWPVGYAPPKKEPQKKHVEKSEPLSVPVVPERPPRWGEALRTVSIKGIMSVGGGKYVAVVNDTVVNENDVVSVNFDGMTYKWKIASISADGVKFQKLDASKPPR